MTIAGPIRVLEFWQNDPKLHPKRKRKNVTSSVARCHRPAPMPPEQLAALMRRWGR